ncbi:AbrB/MazE/SpoVT family DNA-binding domain-containing protein [Thermococcus litoralis]|nr:AbrB/MazE/SpoVT family DNA-binding domain-containing protein [Thermococcus litoralis]
MTETIEPLAKFHAKLNVEGRITIPSPTRELLGLNQNDYVEVIVRKIEVDHANQKIYVLKQAYLISRIGVNGTLFLPKDLQREMTLQPKELVEVLLVGLHRFDELLSPKGKLLLTKSQSIGKWAFIEPNQPLPREPYISYYSYVFI